MRMIDWWWKILAIVLLLYVILMGFLVPLKPGFETVGPSRADAGEVVVMRAGGYNIDYTQSEDIRAWLKLSDTFAIAAQAALPWADNTLQASFQIPEEFPDKADVRVLTLVVDDAVHGALVVPSALFVSGGRYDPAAASLWTADPITALHETPGLFYPFRSILHETIRNTYFHVPMWFGMIILFFISAGHSIRYVRRGRMDDDMRALSLARIGTLFGVLGILTGMLWSAYTWGEAWSWDVKQNMAAIALLIYFAYFVLRASFTDEERRARIAATYNIFACAMIIPLLFVIPRMTDSLHPGSGGNPALGGEDLDNTMRMVFYPAVIGWTLLGLWIAQVVYRLKKLQEDEWY